MPMPCVHVSLPYKSVDFLALMRVSLPTGLFDSATHSGACLTLVAWMSYLVFIICISFLIRAKHCWGVGFLFLIWLMSPLIPCSWAGWCSCHAIALFLLWYHLPLFTLLLLSLQAKVLAMPVSYVIPSFSLLPSIPVGPVHITSRASPAHIIP